MAVSVTQHEGFYICLRGAGDSNPTEMHMKSLKSFCSRPKQECSISRFDPDAAQNHGSLVIKAAIVRKSHLRCFVNTNLTFMLVEPVEKLKCLSKSHKKRDHVVKLINSTSTFCHFNTLFSHTGSMCCQYILALVVFLNGVLKLSLE